MIIGSYPNSRPRRNRQSAWTRNLVRENSLSVNDLIWPLFVQEGENQSSDISSMPNVKRWTIDLIVEQAAKAKELGIPAIAIFPQTPADKKTEDGYEGVNPDNLVCRTVRAIKSQVPDIGVICDVALDPYTSHGQDGLIRDGYIDNDLTIEALVNQSLMQAQAGCDILAPSDMMDGRIVSIRDMLETKKMPNVGIMAYSAKYASAFYGPFRDAVGSTNNLKGGKETYQMDPANTDEAMREVSMDIAEGADSIIVKPGMPYLDIIERVTTEFKFPTYAYQVSGEYAMIHAAAGNGWLDLEKTMMESLLAFKRAGASGIWTYFAPDVAKILNR
ncbi:porphobilinogen synthase [Pseudemcibacter aquimaris]|uniref:porphobilinogen synthase n=1 Tax=Pseudemcibacter aquimaris TaxID=2857064 RepID=UPI0020114144|nr:porphobilinogen synthase [Pseudemcibacter aquimaris]MCC3860591.1 porphobilinogen synthase [Pseudemcibacter aquimaris]WDU59412.1 porphobilinogen synthase [Pseudemcibacter aquimaris]